MPGLHSRASAPHGRWLCGPWRAVPVLGITQILAWGALYYTPVLMVPLIAADRGWSRAFAMGGFSLALLTAGAVSPYVGRTIDRLGGHRVMPFGSILGAVALTGLSIASNPVAYLATWILCGVAIAASLYDPAFATLGRIFGETARLPITLLTLAGGFASTVSWPATHALNQAIGWQNTYLVYAGLLVCVAAPLHAFALPRKRVVIETPADAAGKPKPAPLPARGTIFFLVVTAFASFAFVPSALASHMIAIFGRNGIEAGAAVAIGALFGPSQVAARIGELMFGRRAHPLTVALFATAMLAASFFVLGTLGFSFIAAALFAILFGMANGLLTISRGAVPLALFGPEGYGRTLGRIAGPFLAIQAAAPVVVSFVADRFSDTAAMALIAAFAVISLGCFLAVRRRTTAR